MSLTQQFPVPDLDYDSGPVGFTVEDLIRRGSRLRRRRRIAVGGATAAVAVAAVSAATTMFALHGPPSARTQFVIPGESQSPSAAPSPSVTLSYPTVMRPSAACTRVMGVSKCKDQPKEGSPSAALLDVSLPNPAPGFPLRREPDSAAPESLSPTRGAYWADSFLVGRTPPSCTTYPGGGACSPTGPEATVIVTEGPQPTTPNAQNEIEDEPVVQTTTVDGHPTYVTQDDSETVLYFAAGPFAVLVAGDHGATVDDLTTLAESIHGLQ